MPVQNSSPYHPSSIFDGTTPHLHIFGIITNFSDISHTNYSKLKKEIALDIQRWSDLKTSLQGRIAILKMKILGRLNFLFSMIPMPPPPKYFDELRTLTTKFIWNNKRVRIRLRTLQRPKHSGGLAVPDFKLYYWSFQIKQLTIWCNQNAVTPWRQIEIVKPHRFADILFCGLKPRYVCRMFGPIIGNSLKIWFAVQKHMGCNLKLCDRSPVWYNYDLLQQSGPYLDNSWASGGIHTMASHLEESFWRQRCHTNGKFCASYTTQLQVTAVYSQSTTV